MNRILPTTNIRAERKNTCQENGNVRAMLCVVPPVSKLKESFSPDVAFAVTGTIISHIYVELTSRLVRRLLKKLQSGMCSFRLALISTLDLF